MAFPKFQTKEVLNKVLNSGEDALNVDLSDSVTVTVDSEFPAAAALSDDSSNPTTTSVGSHLLGYDSGNTNWNRVEVDDAGHLQIDVLSITAGDNNIGNVDIASIAAGDNNIGNVDIASALPAGSNTIGVVDLGATDNAVLDNIDSNTDYGATTGGGTESGALRVTIANNSTGVVSVDDNGSTLTVDVASGGIASGAIASGAVASGALASGSVVDGAMVTLGAKADAKSTATDTTAITAMQVLKQISASVQEVATDTGTIDSDTDATKTATEASQAALEKMLYGNALVVTAVDGGSTQALGATYESLYVGVGGNVVVTMVGTGNFTFSNVASGQLLPIRITHVINTGTTATNMIALKA